MTIYPADTPETLNPLIVTTVFGVVALLSCVGRLYALHARKQGFREEEYCIAAALFLTYVSLGIQWACVLHGGTGRHVGDVNSKQLLDTILTLCRTRIPQLWPVAQKPYWVSGFQTGYRHIVAHSSPYL